MSTVLLSLRSGRYDLKMLALPTLAGCVLLGVRILYTGTPAYTFLLWNLFLAWVPLVLSSGLLVSDKIPFAGKISLLGLWLLFFPNAPYIFTDLFHLHTVRGVPLWYDLCMILTFGWTGLAVGFISLEQVLEILKRRLSSFWLTITTGGIFLLTGFGVYLGRYLRWNSWDIISHPMALMGEVADHVLHPLVHYKATGFSLCFGLFLAVAFLTFRYRGKAVR